MSIIKIHLYRRLPTTIATSPTPMMMLINEEKYLLTYIPEMHANIAQFIQFAITALNISFSPQDQQIVVQHEGYIIPHCIDAKILNTIHELTIKVKSIKNDLNLRGSSNGMNTVDSNNQVLPTLTSAPPENYITQKNNNKNRNTAFSSQIRPQLIVHKDRMIDEVQLYSHSSSSTPKFSQNGTPNLRPMMVEQHFKQTNKHSQRQKHPQEEKTLEKNKYQLKERNSKQPQQQQSIAIANKTATTTKNRNKLQTPKEQSHKQKHPKINKVSKPSIIQQSPSQSQQQSEQSLQLSSSEQQKQVKRKVITNKSSSQKKNNHKIQSFRKQSQQSSQQQQQQASQSGSQSSSQSSQSSQEQLPRVIRVKKTQLKQKIHQKELQKVQKHKVSQKTIKQNQNNQINKQKEVNEKKSMLQQFFTKAEKPLLSFKQAYVQKYSKQPTIAKSTQQRQQQKKQQQQKQQQKKPQVIKQSDQNAQKRKPLPVTYAQRRKLIQADDIESSDSSSEQVDVKAGKLNVLVRQQIGKKSGDVVVQKHITPAVANKQQQHVKMMPPSLRNKHANQSQQQSQSQSQQSQSQQQTNKIAATTTHSPFKQHQLQQWVAITKQLIQKYKQTLPQNTNKQATPFVKVNNLIRFKEIELDQQRFIPKESEWIEGTVNKIQSDGKVVLSKVTQLGKQYRERYDTYEHNMVVLEVNRNYLTTQQRVIVCPQQQQNNKMQPQQALSIAGNQPSSLNKENPKQTTQTQHQEKNSIQKFICGQVNYYFSDKNYPFDLFMQMHANKHPQKYIPIRFLLNFPKIKKVLRDEGKLVQYLVEDQKKGERNFQIDEERRLVRKMIVKSKDSASIVAGAEVSGVYKNAQLQQQKNQQQQRQQQQQPKQQQQQQIIEAIPAIQNYFSQ